MSVVAADVKRLIPLTGMSDADLNVFIEDATLIVTEALTGKGLTSGRIDIITKYVAAHLTVISDERGGLRSEKISESTETYNSTAKAGAVGLATTRFGQQAMAFDTTGILADMTNSSSRLKAQFRVVGGCDESVEQA